MLKYLFCDMNSYFASVEQELRPECRGVPMAVVPMMADTTCVIAASYQAKAFGVGTGTRVSDAKQMCPPLMLVEANPEKYVEFHHRIVEAIESCVHVDHICSIDEVYGRLIGAEQSPDRAAAIAYKIKGAIREAVGPRIRCSIGIAPNAWMAKVASDLQKPDGLAMLLPEQLPEALYRLKLTDLPGIAGKMEVRLNALGIRHVYQLCAASQDQLAKAWASTVLGSIWFDQLRGRDLPYRPTTRRMVGHSHVLPPADRTDERAKAIMVRLIHRAATRMRKLGYWATRLSLYVDHYDSIGWEKSFLIGLCKDTPTMVAALVKVWPTRPRATPLRIGMVLSGLIANASAETPLFPGHVRRSALADVMDRINTKYGGDTLIVGAMVGTKGSAPVRISFTQIPQKGEF